MSPQPLQGIYMGNRKAVSGFNVKPGAAFLFNRKLRSLLNKNAPLWMRTPRLRKLVADATALRRECAQERTLFLWAGGRRTGRARLGQILMRWKGIFSSSRI